MFHHPATQDRLCERCGVDGLLVGSASLDAKGFGEVVQNVMRAENPISTTV
ncbi:MAG: hypothetical protein KBD21_05465 [Candidatus Pacebacteria bacterium]|nr:hypothetical protein [Candidatus Paceibacterota bacterium]